MDDFILQEYDPTLDDELTIDETMKALDGFVSDPDAFRSRLEAYEAAEDELRERGRRMDEAAKRVHGDN